MKNLPGLLSMRGIGLTTVSLAILSCSLFPTSNSVAFSSSKQIVGGPCSYRSYPGEAEVMSVKPKADLPGAFEVMFAFHPQEVIQEEFAKTKDRQWPMVLNDLSDPRENLLKQHGIKPGKRIPCIMKVIIKGTCTPVLFDFPTIDQFRKL